MIDILHSKYYRYTHLRITKLKTAVVGGSGSKQDNKIKVESGRLL